MINVPIIHTADYSLLIRKLKKKESFKKNVFKSGDSLPQTTNLCYKPPINIDLSRSSKEVNTKGEKKNICQKIVHRDAPW